MKSKKKAKELYDKFFNDDLERFTDWANADYEATRCALICVDEIIDVLESYGGLCDVLDDYEYWQQVKQEIEKC